MSEASLQSPWLDAHRAAVYIGRRSKNAYKGLLRMARDGKIRAGYDGKTFRFKAEDLDSFLYMQCKEVQR